MPAKTPAKTPARRESVSSDGKASVLSKSTYCTAVSDDVTPRRWCNFMYATRCPFCVHHASGKMEPCKFMHLDAVSRMGEGDRKEIAMPNLMLKHMRGLQKELQKVVDNRARDALNTWSVQQAWSGRTTATVTTELSPYAETLEGLRALGWAINEPASNEFDTAGRLEDAPYAKDVATILNLIATCLHYDLQGCPQIMFATVAWVFSLESPTIKLLNPEVQPGDLLAEFADEPKEKEQPVKAKKKMPELPMLPAVADDDELPPLLESVSELSSSHDVPETPQSSLCGSSSAPSPTVQWAPSAALFAMMMQQQQQQAAW
eukprot:TRINITY_DN1320_c2_g1_i1.p1 TRINITY_DN1320_c2_g1~~TRINITY_DN1320_c2_g1_i1.p1  ORF type:complete len:318 (+),score=142.48 TRINITY_DN1320_c2_g1_i1:64-1017(+)